MTGLRRSLVVVRRGAGGTNTPSRRRPCLSESLVRRTGTLRINLASEATPREFLHGQDPKPKRAGATPRVWRAGQHLFSWRSRQYGLGGEMMWGWSQGKPREALPEFRNLEVEAIWRRTGARPPGQGTSRSIRMICAASSASFAEIIPPEWPGLGGQQPCLTSPTENPARLCFRTCRPGGTRSGSP